MMTDEQVAHMTALLIRRNRVEAALIREVTEENLNEMRSVQFAICVLTYDAGGLEAVADVLREAGYPVEVPKPN